jgi:hypothetical protein
MASGTQFGSRARQLGERLDPALKEFLDAVVIPALVKEYLSEYQRETKPQNSLVVVRDSMANSASESSYAEEGR